MPTTYAIPDGRTVMAATTWTGDNTTPKSISNNNNGVAFQPDFVWLKSRSNAYQNNLYDSVRGAGAAFALSSDQTAAEGGNSSTYGYLSAFNSTGFQVTQGSAGSGGAPNGNAYTNQTSTTYVGWQWKAGGSAVSNTAGSITSSVSANTTAGFSVVTYTGTGANATVGHGLGVVPGMIIIKGRTTTYDWRVWHNTFATGYDIQLNVTSAATSAPTVYTSAPTSTVINIGSGLAINQSGATYVAYCFAPVAGYSAFGSYTGNGSTDGPFVYTGFRPRWLLLKNTGGVASWYCLDSSRNTYNVEDAVLVPNTSAAEVAITSVDFLSNGFKLRTTTTDINGSGTTYIYACFAENPFKYANAR